MKNYYDVNGSNFVISNFLQNVTYLDFREKTSKLHLEHFFEKCFKSHKRLK